MPTTTIRRLDAVVADAAGLPVVTLSERQRQILKIPGLVLWVRGSAMLDLTNGVWRTRTFGDRAFTVQRAGVVPTNPTRNDFNSQKVVLFGDTTANLGEMRNTTLHPIGTYTFVMAAAVDPVNTAAFPPYWGDERGAATGSYLDHSPDGTMRWRHNAVSVVNSVAGQIREKKLIVASYLHAVAATDRRALLRTNRNPATQWTNNNVSAGANTSPNLHIGQCGPVNSLGFVNRNGVIGDFLVFDGNALGTTANAANLALVEAELGDLYGIAAP